MRVACWTGLTNAIRWAIGSSWQTAMGLGLRRVRAIWLRPGSRPLNRLSPQWVQCRCMSSVLLGLEMARLPAFFAENGPLGWHGARDLSGRAWAGSAARHFFTCGRHAALLDGCAAQHDTAPLHGICDP